ncbi:MAG: energy-coupling factor transporter ATPase [Coriobacteriia bacterium]|nr:energy-coupling factor transporter ATPase [Coriobacteriia bacterium]
MPIVLERVTHHYTGSQTTHPSLDDVDLTVDDGEFLGIIGHTGSGKSTLVQLMAGLLQPTAGRVSVDGMDLADRTSRKTVRRRVGVVFQYPEHQLFADSVAEDVAFGPRALDIAPDDIQRRVTDALARVDMDICTYGHRSPFELSGGQMRRVAIAGVLATGPSILILDEPMAGLDPAGRAEAADMLRRLHGQGLSIVMVSHDMDDIAALADRILVLNHARVFAHGTPADVFAHAAQLREIGLGIPHAARFAQRLAACGMLSDAAVFTSDALADAVAGALRHAPGSEVK